MTCSIRQRNNFMCAEKWASAESMATDVNRTYPIHLVLLCTRNSIVYAVHLLRNTRISKKFKKSTSTQASWNSKQEKDRHSEKTTFIQKVLLPVPRQHFESAWLGPELKPPTHTQTPRWEFKIDCILPVVVYTKSKYTQTHTYIHTPESCLHLFLSMSSLT